MTSDEMTNEEMTTGALQSPILIVPGTSEDPVLHPVTPGLPAISGVIVGSRQKSYCLPDATILPADELPRIDAEGATAADLLFVTMGLLLLPRGPPVLPAPGRLLLLLGPLLPSLLLRRIQAGLRLTLPEDLTLSPP